MSWIKLHRQFLEWEWFDSAEMVKVFLYLLLSANFEDRRWHGKIVRRGQLLTSWDALSEATKISVRTLRTCVARLEQTGEITRKSTNKNTVITICNYDRYQLIEEDDRQTTDKQPTSNRQATDNNIRNKEIYNISLSNAPAHVREDWRNLSSMRKASLGHDRNRIAEYKQVVFRQQVAGYAEETGMPPDQQEAFVRYWTEHNPGSDTIRAEYESTFDVRSRMTGWMSREKPRAQAQQPQRSRMERFADDMQFINDFFDGKQGTAVDEQ